MAGARTKPNGSGKFQGYYRTAAGRTRFFTGTTSRAETVRIARRLEDDERQVALGYRPAKTAAAKHKARPFADAAAEYTAWGEAQGGRGGRPWSAVHARKVKTGLADWQAALGLETLADLGADVLARVEARLRELAAGGASGKTLQNRVAVLAAFCRWAKRRGVLETDPLAGMAGFDTTPQSTRRALTREEIAKLLAVAPPERAMLYRVALASGLRAGELRALTVADLDTDRGGLHVRAETAKSRKAAFQPLPAELVAELADYAAGKPGSVALLAVPTHTGRAFRKDADAAGLDRRTFKGKADFHALRVTFVSGVLAAGVDVKTAQALARHATPNLTLNTYGRERDERLRGVAEAVAADLLPGREIATGLHKAAAGGEGIDVTSADARASTVCGAVRDGGSIPPASTKPTNQTVSPRRTARRRTPAGVRVYTPRAQQLATRAELCAASVNVTRSRHFSPVAPHRQGRVHKRPPFIILEPDAALDLRPQNLVLLPQIFVLKSQLPAQQSGDGGNQRQSGPVGTLIRRLSHALVPETH
jgi:integrase